MSEQYFSADPKSESRPAVCEFAYRGRTLRFTTDAGVFSRGGVDTGSRILLNALPNVLKGRALDLGCGWGAIGVSVGSVFPDLHVVMTDVNSRALSLAEDNAIANGVNAECIQSDGLIEIPGNFNVIFTNPPIRAGKQVIYRLFRECSERLSKDGEMYLVIRKQQGAPSAYTYLCTLFRTVDIIEKGSGYWIFRCSGGQIHAI